MVWVCVCVCVSDREWGTQALVSGGFTALAFGRVKGGPGPRVQCGAA